MRKTAAYMVLAELLKERTAERDALRTQCEALSTQYNELRAKYMKLLEKTTWPLTK
jgi:hypothetical protein